jgi:hypothetical protein
MTEAEYDEMMILKERGIKKIDDLEVNEDEIDTALSLIDENQKEVAEKKEEVIEEKPEISIDDITRVALDSYKDIQKHSEEIYDAFYGRVATNQDRTDVSKQMLTDSQRIKIESINALANLANAKAKLIAAERKASQGNVGVFINSQRGEDVGINLANLGD